jgi:protein-tyrosine phosphatase
MNDDLKQQSISRHLPFDGTPNFRDYGGYLTKDGRSVKWRQLFRSGQLSSLTAEDQNQFERLDIQLVFDFRRVEECERDPSIFPAAAIPKVVGLPIDPGSSISFFDNIATGNISAQEMAEFMCVVNREFVLDQGDNYRKMFSHLLNQSQGGSLVHCAAGKDRTGFAAAMVLSALGVPKETIFADYMLTADYLSVDREIDRIQEKYQWTGDADAFRPMLEVHESYLQAAFDAIDQNFPSVEVYLEEILGLGQSECELLQGRYLV